MKTNMNVSFTGYKNVAGVVYGVENLNNSSIILEQFDKNIKKLFNMV